MARLAAALAAAWLVAAGAPLPQADRARDPGFSAILANPDRPETDRARDADRHPIEMLRFAGVRPGWKVAELAPGGGYFTRLLSLAVGPMGRVYAVETRPEPAVELWAQSHANTTLRGNGAEIAPEPVDLVWTTNNYHDFKNVKLDESDAAARINGAAFRALKPGGTYLVADHQAAEGAGAGQTGTLHRIEAALVIREVESAGFRLDATSDVLRHPADDHRKPIFDPSVQGRTDQFVLRFRKP